MIKLLETQQSQAGFNALDHLINSSPPTFPEIRALQDKARITLGYYTLRQNNAKQAIDYFSDISLNSPYSLWGLYGLGRSAYTVENYKNALKYWLALEKQSIDNTPHVEARLAISQLYFRLGSLQLSLDGFIETIELCKQEVSDIDKTITLLSPDANNTDYLTTLLANPQDQLHNNQDYRFIFTRPHFAELLARVKGDGRHT